MGLIISVLACFLIIIFIRANYLSRKNDEILGQLQHKYSTAKVRLSKKTRPQIFYYWAKEAQFKKEYLNGVYVFSDEEGVYFKPSLFYFGVNALYIPWSELVKEGQMKRYFEQKNVYLIKSIGVFVAFTED